MDRKTRDAPQAVQADAGRRIEHRCALTRHYSSTETPWHLIGHYAEGVRHD